MDDGFRLFQIPNNDLEDWLVEATTSRSDNGFGRFVDDQRIANLAERFQNGLSLGGFNSSLASSSSSSRINNGASIGQMVPDYYQRQRSWTTFDHSLASTSSGNNYLSDLPSATNSPFQYGPSRDNTPHYYSSLSNPNSLISRRDDGLGLSSSGAYLQNQRSDHVLSGLNVGSNQSLIRRVRLHGHHDDHLRNGPIMTPSSRLRSSSLAHSLPLWQRESIPDMARDQKRCRSLQDLLERRVPLEISAIFSAVRMDLRSLAVHQIGNYFVQKLIDVVEQDRRREIVSIFTVTDQALSAICTDDNGNKVMMKLVERLRENAELQNVLMGALGRITLVLTKSTNCKQLLDNCLELFPHEAKKPILFKIAENCIEIATDKSGCCILQKCFHQDNLEVFQRLVNDVTEKAHFLSEHCYGNYIVQYLIELEIPFVNKSIAATLKRNFISLSMNKHSSNVVEKLMMNKSQQEVAKEIIVEIMGSSQFLRVLQDEFGNYVAQTALRVSKSRGLTLHNDLIKLIVINAEHLQNHPHGRNVLRAITTRQIRRYRG